MFDSTQALLTIQKLFGPFPKIVGKGDYAQASRVYHSVKDILRLYRTCRN